MRASDLTNDKRAIIVTYGSEETKVTYRPSAWTASSQDALMDAEDFTPILELLEKGILEWDVTEDDGSPFAITVENLDILPIAFVLAITNAVWDDMAPGEARRGSAAGSRRRGR